MKHNDQMKENKTQVRDVILRTVKTQKLLSAGIVITVVGAIIAALIPPLILAEIVDTITEGNGAPLFLILSYFGMIVITGMTESAREGLLTVFGQKITHALRSSMMKKFISLTADNINRQEPGTVVSRFVGDVDTVENLFSSGIISMFADACKILSILFVIWFENRGLTLVLLILLPFLFGFTRHVQKNMLTAQIENRKAVGRASGHVPETLHNIRTIHCLGKENYMEKRYDQYIGESYRAMERTNFYDAVYSPVILILNAVVVAVVMLLSASGNSQILRSFGMSAGTAVAVINYISQIFGPVEFKDVTFGYDENVVLDHVKFQVREGEQVTLAGRTGAGKSTILKLLLGLYEPQDGEVLVRGIPAAQIQAQDRRTIFGYVEQSFHMVPGTVKDQITLYDEGITDEQVREVIGLVGLKEAVEGLENGVDTWCTAELFSQGQWQLLSVARAAVAGPAILLLDEITANLDAETEQNVLMALKKVSKDRTVISISHRMTASMGRTIFIS